KAGLEKFRQMMLPAWRHTLQLNWPQKPEPVWIERLNQSSSSLPLKVKRDGEELVVGSYWPPSGGLSNALPMLVVYVETYGDTMFRSVSTPAGFPQELQKRGIGVVWMTPFMSDIPPADQFANFYTTYNRTVLQQCVRDLVAVCAGARSADL